MKAIVIGSGTIGSALKKSLEEKGHEVVSVGRKSGDYRADISDPESLKALFGRLGSFDAVANPAVDLVFGPLEQSTDEQWANSVKSKGMGQSIWSGRRSRLSQIRALSHWYRAC
jgi:nucleoside-diphosphate-sugar epimerase